MSVVGKIKTSAELTKCIISDYGCAHSVVIISMERGTGMPSSNSSWKGMNSYHPPTPESPAINTSIMVFMG